MSHNANASAAVSGVGARLWSKLAATGTLAQDILASTLGNGLVFIASLLAYGFAARRFSELELGQYMLLRRVIQSLMPVVMLGMPVALSRHLALTAQAQAGAGLAVAFSAAIVLLGLLVLVCGASIFPATAARLLLGDASAQAELAALLLWLAGTVWSQQLYAMYMGRMQTRLANAVQVCGGALAPVLPFIVLPAATYAAVVSASAWSTIAACMLFTIGPLRWLAGCSATWRGASQRCALYRSLLIYGLSRVPGFAAMAGMWTVLPLLLVARGDGAANTYVMAGLQALLLVSLVLQPISAVLLPRVAYLHGAGQDGPVRQSMELVHAMLLDCGLVLLLQVPLVVPVLLRQLLLLAAPEGVTAATQIALAVPACISLNILRNPLDAISRVPYNTYMLAAALALQLLLFMALDATGLDRLTAAAAAISLSFTALGAAAWWISCKLFASSIALLINRRTLVLGMLAVVCYLGGSGILRLSQPWPGWMQCLLVILLEFLVAIICILYLYKIKRGWVLFLISKINSRRATGMKQ